MIEVRGYIDDLLANKEQKDVIRNVEDQDELLMSMIDAPIIYKGKAIGVINDIDLDENAWCGIIWGDMGLTLTHAVGIYLRFNSSSKGEICLNFLDYSKETSQKTGLICLISTVKTVLRQH